MAHLLNFQAIPQRLMSGHLWSFVLLVAGTFVALTAERLAAGARAPLSAGAAVASLGDIAPFVTPPDAERVDQRGGAPLLRDPFEGPGPVIPVASGQRGPTVNPGSARQLTAILMADDQTVAVIDGVVVKVGDVLPDGGRVASIRSDRVAIAARDGRMRVLIIPSGRQ